MVCKYFVSDILGSCGATGFLHIPRISEMEQLCFKDFQDCSIYTKYEDSHIPVIVDEDYLSAKRLSPAVR